MRTVIAGLVVVGLAVAVFLAWPRGGEDEPPGDATATTMTTTTTTSGTTSTAPPTTAGSHVVTSVDEAESILRELWFGWFEGIYNQDEDRIREVVVLDETVNTAKESFGTIELRPAISDIHLDQTELLRADDECLAVWTTLRLTGFRVGSSEGLHVIRWSENSWRRLSLWQYRDDLWDLDCESQLP